ncbi:MAG: gliding motility-associated C-terminal domain-containing protein, partial [Ferruginibacter sp.]
AGCFSAESTESLSIAMQPMVEAGPDLFLQPGETSIITASIINAANYDFLWTPSTALSSPIILTPITSSPNDITYRIMASDKLNNCVAYDTMSVKIVRTIFVPNAFTPNGDGLNDTWRIPALAAYPEASVTVFNRYGQKIFESKGYNRPWDGTYKGSQQPMGSYIYIIHPDVDAIEILKGTVTIIR